MRGRERAHAGQWTTLLALGLAWLALERSAAAATFVVNSTVDANDAAPGDGLCATAAGDCTLRAAVQESNANVGADVIDLPTGTYTLSIVGRSEDAAATGDLDVTEDLTVRGVGRDTTIIDAAGIDRVFQTVATAPLALSDLTLTRGDAVPENRTGGAILASGPLNLAACAIVESVAMSGGGVRLLGTGPLTATAVEFRGNTALGAAGAVAASSAMFRITDSVFADNHAGTQSGAIDVGAAGRGSAEGCTFRGNIAETRGGAAYLLNATVTVDNCIFDDNQAWQSGGALVAFGGALTVTSSSFTANRAGYGSVVGGVGGAVQLQAGDQFTFTDCTFTGNQAQFDGGAVDLPLSSNADVSLRRVTIDSCSAEQFGGAISIQFNSGGSNSIVRLFDSTLSRNTAAVAGGAIFMDWGRIAPQAILTNCTVSANSAPEGGAVRVGDLPTVFVEGRLSLFGSTLAGNDSIGGSLSFPFPSEVEMGGSILADTLNGDDCVGAATITSLGFNIIENPGTCAFVGATADDLVGADPLLGPLQDNGGPTFTQALLVGSAAIDLNAPCLDEIGSMLVADQRGQERPIDGDRDGIFRCDTGAFEAGCDVDGDGDTVGDNCDCAPLDPTTLRLPAEADIRVAKDAPTEDALLTWADLSIRAGGSTLHDVASDSIGALWLRRVADAACVATGIGPSWRDSRAITDRGWYYLVRGTNACGPGPGLGWGSDSLGVARPTCP